MPYANYHINTSFSNKLVELFYIFLSIILPPRSTKTYFRTGLIVKLNSLLSNELTYSEGLKVLVKGFNQSKAKEEYRKAEKQLKEFRNLYKYLSKADFFKNPDTKEL